MVSAFSDECGKQSYTIRKDMGDEEKVQNKGLKKGGVCIHLQVMADSLGSLRHSFSNPDASQHFPGVFDHSAVNLVILELVFAQSLQGQDEGAEHCFVIGDSCLQYCLQLRRRPMRP